MHISVRKDPGALMRHIIHVRDHQIATDLDVAGGGEGSGPDPHDLYDSSLGACVPFRRASHRSIPLPSGRLISSR